MNPTEGARKRRKVGVPELISEGSGGDATRSQLIGRGLEAKATVISHWRHTEDLAKDAAEMWSRQVNLLSQFGEAQLRVAERVQHLACPLQSGIELGSRRCVVGLDAVGGRTMRLQPLADLRWDRHQNGRGRPMGPVSEVPNILHSVADGLIGQAEDRIGNRTSSVR